MELNVNSPQFYTKEFGVHDEIYVMCQKLREYFKEKNYSEYINIIGIIPIVAPEEVLVKGLCRPIKKCEIRAGFASIARNINYNEFVEASMEDKKGMIIKCILDSVKSVKGKGKIDYAKFEKDMLLFCDNNDIKLNF